jgi:carboxylesterase type B
MNRNILAAARLLLTLSLLACSGQGLAQCETPVVKLATGAACGKKQPAGQRTAYAFLGLPYAETTAGNNRFAAPVPKKPWEGTFEATRFGPVCPQTRSPRLKGLGQSEDCLSVNVWQPEGARRGAPLPVLVFIPGGMFQTSSSAKPLFHGSDASVYDGAYLATSQNLIVVTFNYRLGALGFLAGAAGLEGNFGLLDQQLALEWVRDNIAAFGGNPERVTLAGQSAGAMSVALHLLSIPSSEHLFEAAILQSNPFTIPYRQLEEVALSADIYLLSVGCRYSFDQLACLRSRSVSELLARQENLLLWHVIIDNGLAGIMVWAPVLDGNLVVRQPFEAAKDGQLTKPVLLGSNAQEATIFFESSRAPALNGNGIRLLLGTFFGPGNVGRNMAHYRGDAAGKEASRLMTDYLFTCSIRTVAAAARADVYLYEFTKIPSFNINPDAPACRDESCHNAELAFVFRSSAPQARLTPAEAELSEQMVRYWGRFASALHNPNLGNIGALRWPEFNREGSWLVFDTPITVGRDAPASCELWAEDD